MDGRSVALIGVLMLGIASGCTHTKPLQHGDLSVEPKLDSQGAVVHNAHTFCKFGDMIASAAFDPEKSPESRKQAREEARLSYAKAIETDPKHMPAYVSMARIQQSGDDYAAAAGTLAKAAQIEPGNAAVWYDLGLCQGRLKQWPESVASLKKACELNPGSRPYLTTLAYTLGRAGQVQDSLALLTQLHGEAKANYDLARLMRHMNQPAVAKQLAAQAVAKDPNLPGAKQLVAELSGQPKPPTIQAASFTKVAKPAASAPVVIQASATAKRLDEGSATDTEPTASVSANQGDSAKPIRIPPLPVRRK